MNEKKIISKIFDGVDFILLAQDMDQWRTLVNTVMNIRVP
jgi:hypothetical protein